MTTVSVVTQDDRHRCSSLVSVDGRTYTLKSARINARAEGGIAATTLTQTYENPYPEALEVLYTMPLPADGAVTDYTVRMGKRVIRGEVRKREQAREEYRKALFEGRPAALLEQERADTFSQKLGSLPPGETATIEIEVLQPLAFLPGTKDEQACWEYRFPTVVGVRYEGKENRVPDAETIDVNRAAEGTPARLEASVQIADGPAGDIRPCVPGYEIRIQEEENAATVRLKEGVRLDRDLVVRWTAAKQETDVRTVEGKGLPCDNGRYVLITLTPPKAPANVISRDLTLLIDSSGSMEGQPLEQAKTVAIELLRSLAAGDRFEILAFSNKVRRLTSGQVDAGEENTEQALGELRKLRASGGTEMTEALIEALQPLRPGSQRQIILLSDGYIGFENEVVGEIWRRLLPGARVHVVGVGSAPNRTLTRGAARAGRGIEIVIGLEEDARKATGRLLQATVHPILTDILVEGSAVVSHSPQKPRDVFAGQPALIFAEVKPGGGRLEISGKIAGDSSRWIHTVDVGLQQASKELSNTTIPIGALFGREAIEDAEIDLAASKGKSDAIEKRIESLGLRHGIASRMTSLIAISEDTTVDPKDPRRRERLPVEMPAGVSAEGAGLMRPVFDGAAAAGGFYQLAEMTRGVRARSMRRLGGGLAQRLGRRLSVGMENSEVARPSGPIVIEEARVLELDDQILVFEFETPVDGFVLPDQDTKVDVLFGDCGPSTARVLEQDSTKPGPHPAGLTVRLVLRLEGHRCWHHDAARIQWKGVEAEVEIRLRFGRER